jgi:hypothetical protein
MDDQASQDRLLRELIDAARPAGKDLAHPDFALLARRAEHDPRIRQILHRSRRLDLAIGEALDDLPVPPGSVERLLAVLEAAARSAAAAPTTTRAKPAIDEMPAIDPAPSEQSPIVGPAATEGSRRPMLLAQPWAGAVSLGAAAAVALAAYFVFRPAGGAWTPDEILASDWLANVDEAAAEQTLVEVVPPPRKYPAAKALTVQPATWRWVKGLLGRSRGVAYQLRAPAAKATLYVIDDDAGHDSPQIGPLPASPPSGPRSTTGGRAMSVWRSNGLVYILVVQGGAAEYKAFVSPAGQLARHGAAGHQLKSRNLPSRWLAGLLAAQSS